MELPPRERRRQIRRAIEDAVALVRAGDGEADALHLLPRELVFFEEEFESGDPSRENGVGAGLRIGGALCELKRNGCAVCENTASFGSRRAAVCSEEDGFHEGIYIISVMAVEKRNVPCARGDIFEIRFWI